MPKCPHGELDFLASVWLVRHPGLSIEEIAAKLGCSPGTLRNRRKYPRFASAWTEMTGSHRFSGVRAAARRRKGRLSS